MAVRYSLSLWARVAGLIALFLIFGAVPAITALNPQLVPPIEALNRTQGTISFVSVSRKGVITAISRDDGTTEEFSCRKYSGGTHVCIQPRHQGQRAEVLWFWVDMRFGNRFRYPVQISVDGDVIRDRQKTIENISKSRERILFLLLPFTLILVIVCVVIMINYERTKKDATGNR